MKTQSICSSIETDYKDSQYPPINEQPSDVLNLSGRSSSSLTNEDDILKSPKSHHSWHSDKHDSQRKSLLIGILKDQKTAGPFQDENKNKASFLTPVLMNTNSLDIKHNSRCLPEFTSLNSPEREIFNISPDSIAISPNCKNRKRPSLESLVARLHQKADNLNNSTINEDRNSQQVELGSPCISKGNSPSNISTDKSYNVTEKSDEVKDSFSSSTSKVNNLNSLCSVSCGLNYDKCSLKSNIPIYHKEQQLTNHLSLGLDHNAEGKITSQETSLFINNDLDISSKENNSSLKCTLASDKTKNDLVVLKPSMDVNEETEQCISQKPELASSSAISQLQSSHSSTPLFYDSPDASQGEMIKISDAVAVILSSFSSDNPNAIIQNTDDFVTEKMTSLCNSNDGFKFSFKNQSFNDNTSQSEYLQTVPLIENVLKGKYSVDNGSKVKSPLTKNAAKENDLGSTSNESSKLNDSKSISSELNFFKDSPNPLISISPSKLSEDDNSPFSKEVKYSNTNTSKYSFQQHKQATNISGKGNIPFDVAQSNLQYQNKKDIKSTKKPIKKIGKANRTFIEDTLSSKDIEFNSIENSLESFKELSCCDGMIHLIDGLQLCIRRLSPCFNDLPSYEPLLFPHLTLALLFLKHRLPLPFLNQHSSQVCHLLVSNFLSFENKLCKLCNDVQRYSDHLTSNNCRMVLKLCSHFVSQFFKLFNDKQVKKIIFGQNVSPFQFNSDMISIFSKCNSPKQYSISNDNIENTISLCLSDINIKETSNCPLSPNFVSEVLSSECMEKFDKSAINEKAYELNVNICGSVIQKNDLQTKGKSCKPAVLSCANLNPGSFSFEQSEKCSITQDLSIKKNNKNPSSPISINFKKEIELKIDDKNNTESILSPSIHQDKLAANSLLLSEISEMTAFQSGPDNDYKLSTFKNCATPTIYSQFRAKLDCESIHDKSPAWPRLNGDLTDHNPPPVMPEADISKKDTSLIVNSIIAAIEQCTCANSSDDVAFNKQEDGFMLTDLSKGQHSPLKDCLGPQNKVSCSKFDNNLVVNKHFEDSKNVSEEDLPEESSGKKGHLVLSSSLENSAAHSINPPTLYSNIMLNVFTKSSFIDIAKFASNCNICILCKKDYPFLRNHISEHHTCLSFTPVKLSLAFHHHMDERVGDVPYSFCDTLYGESLYLCRDCNFASKSMETVRIHLNLHQNVYLSHQASNRCLCKKKNNKFMHSSLKSSLKESKYTCLLCHQIFICKEGFIAHFRLLHANLCCYSQSEFDELCLFNFTMCHQYLVSDNKTIEDQKMKQHFSYITLNNELNYLDGKKFRLDTVNKIAGCGRVKLSFPIKSVPDYAVLPHEYNICPTTQISKYLKGKFSPKVSKEVSNYVITSFDFPIQMLLHKRHKDSRFVKTKRRINENATDFFTSLGLLNIENKLNKKVITKSEDDSLLPVRRSLRQANITKNTLKKDFEIPKEEAIQISRTRSGMSLMNETINKVSDDPQPDSYKTAIEISGEWGRSHTFVCCSCGAIFLELADVMDHKWVSHPNVWCAHTMIIGQPEVPSEFCKQYLPPLENQSDNFSVSESVKDFLKCSLCNAEFKKIQALHVHLVECGRLDMMAPAKKRNKKGIRFRRRKGQGIPSRRYSTSILTTPHKQFFEGSGSSTPSKDSISNLQFSGTGCGVKRRLEMAVQSIENLKLKRKLQSILATDNTKSSLNILHRKKKLGMKLRQRRQAKQSNSIRRSVRIKKEEQKKEKDQKSLTSALKKMAVKNIDPKLRKARILIKPLDDSDLPESDTSVSLFNFDTKEKEIDQDKAKKGDLRKHKLVESKGKSAKLLKMRRLKTKTEASKHKVSLKTNHSLLLSKKNKFNSNSVPPPVKIKRRIIPIVDSSLSSSLTNSDDNDSETNFLPEVGRNNHSTPQHIENHDFGKKGSLKKNSLRSLKELSADQPGNVVGDCCNNYLGRKKRERSFSNFRKKKLLKSSSKSSIESDDEEEEFIPFRIPRTRRKYNIGDDDDDSTSEYFTGASLKTPPYSRKSSFSSVSEEESILSRATKPSFDKSSTLSQKYRPSKVSKSVTRNATKKEKSTKIIKNTLIFQDCIKKPFIKFRRSSTGKKFPLKDITDVPLMVRLNRKASQKKYSEKILMPQSYKDSLCLSGNPSKNQKVEEKVDECHYTKSPKIKSVKNLKRMLLKQSPQAKAQTSYNDFSNQIELVKQSSTKYDKFIPGENSKKAKSLSTNLKFFSDASEKRTTKRKLPAKIIVPNKRKCIKNLAIPESNLDEISKDSETYGYGLLQAKTLKPKTKRKYVFKRKLTKKGLLEQEDGPSSNYLKKTNEKFTQLAYDSAMDITNEKQEETFIVSQSIVSNTKFSDSLNENFSSKKIDLPKPLTQNLVKQSSSKVSSRKRSSNSISKAKPKKNVFSRRSSLDILAEKFDLDDEDIPLKFRKTLQKVGKATNRPRLSLQEDMLSKSVISSNSFEEHSISNKPESNGSMVWQLDSNHVKSSKVLQNDINEYKLLNNGVNSPLLKKQNRNKNQKSKSLVKKGKHLNVSKEDCLKSSLKKKSVKGVKGIRNHSKKSSSKSCEVTQSSATSLPSITKDNLFSSSSSQLPSGSMLEKHFNNATKKPRTSSRFLKSNDSKNSNIDKGLKYFSDIKNTSNALELSPEDTLNAISVIKDNKIISKSNSEMKSQKGNINCESDMHSSITGSEIKTLDDSCLKNASILSFKSLNTSLKTDSPHVLFDDSDTSTKDKLQVQSPKSKTKNFKQKCSKASTDENSPDFLPLVKCKRKRKPGLSNNLQYPHEEPNGFLCLDCGLTFDSDLSREDHRLDCKNIALEMSLMVDENLFECPHCQLTFAKLGTQRKHSSSCRGKRSRKNTSKDKKYARRPRRIPTKVIPENKSEKEENLPDKIVSKESMNQGPMDSLDAKEDMFFLSKRLCDLSQIKACTIDICSLMLAFSCSTPILRDSLNSSTFFDGFTSLVLTESSLPFTPSPMNASLLEKILLESPCHGIQEDLSNSTAKYKILLSSLSPPNLNKPPLIRIKASRAELLRSLSTIEDILKEANKIESDCKKSQMLLAMKENFQAGTGS